MLFTRRAAVVFDQGAACPTWERVVLEICSGDADLAAFLQRWFGYCCGGSTREQVFCVFFGFGENGKSLLQEVVAGLLGDFARTSQNTLLLKKQSEQTNDLAALEGVRFTICSEPNDGAALDEGRVKSMTGGEQVAARKLFCEYSNFTPRFKINLASNHKPRITGTDRGIWRRAMLVSMQANFENPDKGLRDKLKKEYPGILNWLLAGYRSWAQLGLAVPEVVQAATAEYRTESDSVGLFLAEAWPAYPEVKSSELYKAYRIWAEDNGFSPLNSMRFKQRLLEQGVTFAKRMTGNFYVRTT